MSRIGWGIFGALLMAAPVACAQTPPPAGSRQIVRACAGDIDRLCPGVPPGQGRIKACMKQHVTQLSAPCFDALMAAVAAARE